MIRVVLLVVVYCFQLTHPFKIEQEKEQSAELIINTNYATCTRLVNAAQVVNNNSISTAVPNPTSLFVAVTGRSQPTVYLYPIKPNAPYINPFSQHTQEQLVVKLETPNDGCSQSSAADFSDDGAYLAYGCGSSDTYLYIYQKNEYKFKQTIKNSYNKDGGKIVFSSDGHRLFITQSNKQINIYHQGANLFVIFQTLYVNLHMKNLFALARNAKYLSTIQRNDSAIYLSLHEFSRQNNTYVQVPHTQSVNMIVADMFMNDRFLVLVSAAGISGCSVVVYKIAPDGQSFAFEQQINQTPSNLCARSGYLNYKNQMILTFPSGKSYIYQYINNSKKFVKQYQIAHEVAGPNIFTEQRLIDTANQHLLVYTNVGFNLYCPKIQEGAKIDKR